MASLPDLVRLLALPVFGWAAYTDVRTRRVRDELWYPLLAIGVMLLVAEYFLTPGYARFAFDVRVAVSLLLVPLGYAFWRVGTFGGADFKALAVMGVLLPTYPYYVLAGTALPVVPTPLGVFSLSALTNAMLLTLAYPVVLAVENATHGRFSLWMFVGREVDVERLPRLHGSLLENVEEFTRNGLDLDALRMYLRWRGVTLARLRADPTLRDPATLPRTPNDPTDGAVLPDGGEDAPLADGGNAAESNRDDEDAETPTGHATDTPPSGEPGKNDTPPSGEPGSGSRETYRVEDAPMDEPYGDPWGAERFLRSVPGTAYGTDAATLRAGLDLVTERETVWVTPGLPFVLPLFFGLLVAFTLGDLLTILMQAVAGF